VADVSVSSAAGTLTPARYAARNLLGGPDGAPLEVRADGRIGSYVPATSGLAPHAYLVLDLIHR